MSLYCCLDEILKSRRISMKSLAAKTKLAYSTVFRICKNDFERIEVHSIDVICQALDLVPGDWLRWRSDKPGEVKLVDGMSGARVMAMLQTIPLTTAIYRHSRNLKDQESRHIQIAKSIDTHLRGLLAEERQVIEQENIETLRNTTNFLLDVIANYSGDTAADEARNTVNAQLKERGIPLALERPDFSLLEDLENEE
ncbi:helix-turn-helix transcriptional regulator [Thermosynechococcaceae cyanobacterium BACA0444]|uniref:Helix-turn-helix transcriptional regulator n=1 Tax=Pseudocalidococcus azoricus BACA0444 TaxID=2918990 RepID=A0AAE4JXR7_9CYAN|nr:helix-turn-helix transcriptional regulator [Pseudocalidococcus azoricus]MDS3860159.1 helix-turn-helix transcriptional regulator [Pseudocalidococcus azoricus BACA0444]